MAAAERPEHAVAAEPRAHLAVVCRHDQLVHGALVLSCLPPGQPVLLLVQPPQPHDHAEYRHRFAIFRDHFDRRNELIGGGIGWAAAGPEGRQRLIGLQAAVDGALRELGPYRSWHAHQRSLRRLAQRLAPSQALLLSEDVGDFLTLHATSRESLQDGTTESLLPEATPVHQLTVADPADPESWLQAAWQHLRGTAPLPTAREEFTTGDLASCLCALRRSLASGLPLRQVPAAHGARPGVHHAALRKGVAEVVLLEAEAEADLLLGVLHAGRQGAGVVAYPRLDTARIDAALAAVDEARAVASQHAQTLLGAGLGPQGPAAPDRPKFIGDLLDWVRAQRTGALDAVAQAVSDALPREVSALVGKAAVTVLTSGVPYRFVRHGLKNWADKSIGHVVGDRALLLLGALHPRPPPPMATFDMLFDPGFFDDTDETRHVINALSSRRSYALVLQGEVGSSDALLNLSAELPVELLYFNTHGSREGILLSDQAVPSYKLSQWLTLPSGPVVFNSSCLSWQGVGTQFVRCGASGYIGTLWSVSAPDAADLARVALQRMVHDGAACSSALCDTGVDEATSMAYLFVGTATQRLQAAEQAPVPPAERARSHAQSLLGSARRRLASHGQLRSDDHRRAMVMWLLQQADHMVDDVLLLDAGSTDTFELLLDRIAVWSDLPAPESDARLATLLDDAEQRLAVLGKAAPMAWRLASQRAMWMENRGQLGEALELLRAIDLPGDADTNEAAFLEQRRCDLFKKTNQPQEAHASAQRALDINRRLAGDNRIGIMASLGHLVQTTLRLPGREDEAMASAREGLALAQDLHHASEQVIFALDMARIEHIRGRPDEGVPHARGALALARRSFDNLGELSSVGTLCNLLIATGQFDEALKLVELGLQESAKLKRWTSVGDYLNNAAEIAERQDRPADSFAARLQAAQLFATHGPHERLQALFAWAHEWAERHAPEHAELPVVELAFVIVLQGESASLHWPMARDAVQMLHAWARRIDRPPPAELLARMLAHEPEGKVNGPGSAVGMLLRMLHALASGKADDARAWAERMDPLWRNDEASQTLRHALAHWQAP